VRNAMHEADQGDHFDIAALGRGQGGGRHGESPSKTLRITV
jgi:hypothetical protein